MDAQKPLADLYAAAGLKPLNKLWAKIEILLGLGCVVLGLVFGIASILGSRRNAFPRLDETADPLWFVASLVLFVLGGYLTLAGHRSHLYQSNNTLTAVLLEEIRKQRTPLELRR